MIVLEADGFFRIIHDPAREEDGAVEQAVAQVHDQAHVSTGWLRPGNFIDALPNTDDVGLLIFHPTVAHQTTVNTVVQGVFVFNVNFVIPAIIVGIYQMFADEAA